MNEAQCQVRRATVDDVKALASLWEVARLPVLEMERHLTDFQVVARNDGPLVGAIGLRVAAHQGHLYGEAFFHPEQEDAFRPLLWERIQSVARNHGLTRIWTQEDSPFWHQNGFEEAGEELKQKLPAPFGDRHSHWRSLQLRDEAALHRSLEQEFEVFRTAEQAQREQVLRRARALRLVGTAVVLGLALIVGGALFVLFRKSQQSRPR
jgi:N-acetylglutamate synthase-like GNAT family acetyltransferase